MVAPKTKTARPVAIPADLRGAHPAIAATRDAFKGRTAGPDGRIEARWQQDIFGLTVSRDQLRRALSILHALTHEALARGMEIGSVERVGQGRVAGVGIGAHGHFTRVEIEETTDYIPLTADETARWKHEHRFSWGPSEPPTQRPVANGGLRLKLPERYDRRGENGTGWQQRWNDGTRGPLEGKLDSILVALQERAEADVVRARRDAEAEKQRERQAAIRREQLRLEQIEKDRSERLFAEAAAWRKAGEARDYLAALRTRLPELEGEERERVSAWVGWAESYVVRTDPVQQPELIVGLDAPGRGW